MHTLKQNLKRHIAAGFAGIWIKSYEHTVAIEEIRELAKESDIRLAVWDADAGMQEAGKEAVIVEPTSAVKYGFKMAQDEPGSKIIVVLKNFHRLIDKTLGMIEAIERTIQVGKGQNIFLMILSPVVQIPVELDKQFVVIDHPLPDKAALKSIAENLATEEGDLPKDPDTLLEASAGLTRFEAENAYALSIVDRGKISPETVWDLKAQTLAKSGLLKLYKGGERFSDLGGLDPLKTFCIRSLTHKSTSGLKPKGILLLGVPGAGKSTIAKAIGNEVGRPTVVLDVGNLMGGIVGQTEERTRQALEIIDAMAPCVLFLDEVEKALSGAASQHASSDVSTRQFGAILTWLSDHTSDVYVVTTSNNISAMPPEFSRAGRFDAIFFVDLPGRLQRNEIWDLYLEQFDTSNTTEMPDDNGWTGAEIRQCCYLADLLGLPLKEAANFIVPVSRTASESISALRTWAEGRCLSADFPGVYRQATWRDLSTATGRRKLIRPTQVAAEG